MNNNIPDNRIMNRVKIGDEIKHISQETLLNNLDAYARERGSDRIYVTNPEGKRGTVELRELKDVLDAGYQLVDDTEGYNNRPDIIEKRKAEQPATPQPSAPVDVAKTLNSADNSLFGRTIGKQQTESGIADIIAKDTRPMIEQATVPAKQAAQVAIPKHPEQTNLEYAETVMAAQKRENERFQQQMMEEAGVSSIPESMEEVYSRLDTVNREMEELTGNKEEDQFQQSHLMSSAEKAAYSFLKKRPKELSPEQRQRVNELQEQKTALEVQADLLRKFKKYEEYDKDTDRSALGRFFGGMAAGGDLQALATFGISQINSDLEFMGILEKARNGKKLTSDEQKAIQLYQNLQQIQSKDRGASFSAGAGMQTTFEFMRDMAMFGLGGLAKGAANQGIKQILKHTLRNYGKKTTEIFLKAPITPSFYRNLTANQIANYEIKDGPNGSWDVERKESALKNVYRTYAETATEYASEALGNVFEQIGLVSRLAKSTGKGKGIISKALKSYDRMHNKALHNKWGKFILGGMNQMGLNNMPSEFMEEIAVIPMQSLLLWENQFGQLADPRFYQEVAISTAALGGMHSAVNIAVGGPSAYIERKKVNKEHSDTRATLESIRDTQIGDSPEDIKIKFAIDEILADVDNRNYYNEDYEFTADAIIKDLDTLRKRAGNNTELINKAERYVQLSLYKEGQTEAMRAIIEDEIGPFEYGTSGGVMIGRTNEGVPLFILDEAGKSATVRTIEKGAEPFVMSVADINNIETSTMDAFVTDYFVGKKPGEIKIETIDDIQQMDQQAQQAEQDVLSPIVRGDYALFDGNPVSVIDTYDNRVTIKDVNGEVHDVEVSDLMKVQPTQGKSRYISPTGERFDLVGATEDRRYMLQRLDDNNIPMQQDPIVVTSEDLMQYEQLGAEDASAVEETAQQVDGTLGNEDVQQQETTAEVEQTQELPTDKDGNIDFDTLLAQSPERFLQEYSNVVGQDMAMSQLNKVVANVEKKIQQVTDKLDKATSVNESIKLQQEITALQAQRDSIQSLLQPEETSAAVEETIPAEQETVSASEEISPEVEETIPVSEEIGTVEVENQTPDLTESVKTEPVKAKTILESALDNNANAALEQQGLQVNTEPTEGQKEAGNYKMGHVKINGFDITIENPKGSIRSGIDNNGIPWEVQMNNHYGYFRRTEGKDGDQVDVFIGDSPTSGKIFIVDQVDEKGNFDEHKVMMGFDSIEEAEQAYMSNYSPGWKGLGNITEVSIKDFKEWVKDGRKKTQPFHTSGQYSEPTLLDVVKTLYTKGKDAASKLFQRSFFEVAKTPQFMQDLGLRGEKFTIKYGVISRHIGKDDSHNLTEKNWEQLPNALQNPFAISKLGDKDNSYRIYTTLQAENGEYVVVGADVKNTGREIEVNAISTVFGRRNNASLPKNEEVIYTSNEITPEQSSLLERPNFAQYPTEQELPTGTGKGTQSVSKMQTSEQQESSETTTAPDAKRNRLVSEDRYAQLRERMKGKLSQLNVGIDPEMLSIGIEMAVYHIENGAYKFADFTRKMVADLGDAIRPYLKAFYNGARDLPEMKEYSTQMDSYADVSSVNVNDVTMEETDEGVTISKMENISDVTVEESMTESEPAQTAVRGTVTKDVNTKTGADIWVVKLNDRVERDEFLSLKAEAKNNGGYYSNFKKGFIFTSENDANKFNNIDNETITDTQAEQRSADTIAIASEAETVIGKIGREGEIIRTADEAVSRINECDRALEQVNQQLALLGYYQADYDDSKFNESYGYAKTAEKKALKDAEKLAKSLAKDLGIDVGKKKLASANIAPAGGDIAFRLPLNEERQLYVNISIIPNNYGMFDTQAGEDDLFVRGITSTQGRDAIMYRIENLGASGVNRYGRNIFADADVMYNDLLSGIRSIAADWLPSSQATQQQENKPVMELVKPKEESPNPDFKIGNKVIYNGEIATITDFDMGRPVLDTGLAPLMYELANWSDISKYEPQTTIDNGEETIQQLDGSATTSEREGQPRVENETLGDSQQPQVLTDEQAGVDTDSSTPAGDDTAGSRGVSGRNVNEQSTVESGEKNTHNWRYPASGTGIPTSASARLKANIAAIKVLRELQENNAQATPGQMEVLSRYSGWGGMRTYFNSNAARIPGSEAAQIKELLTDEEYSDAVMSLNSAYYTPVEVIKTLWDVAQQLGFKGGNILEGSAGTGNILGFMPEGISSNSNIEAVEIDSVSGSILSYLYPDAKTHVQGFEKTDIPNGSVDLAITNVPFVTGLNVKDPIDKDLSRKFKDIHNFCIAKNVRKLREGGIGIFITSNGTLDKSKQLREWLVSREGNADVIGAFRLNNRTFEGAPVTSDIIVVRKRVGGAPSSAAIDVLGTTTTKVVPVKVDEKFNKKTGQYEDVTREVALDYNTYFQQHPEYMGGEMAIAAEKGDTFRPASIGLYPVKGIDQGERMRQWVATFSPVEAATPSAQQAAPVYEQSGEKEGALVVDKDGRLCISRRGEAVPLNVNDNKIKGKYTKAEAVMDYNGLKKALADVLEYQTSNSSDEGLAPLLKKLNSTYDGFVKKYGPLNRNVTISFLRNDVDFASIAAVENYSESETIDGKKKIETSKTDVFKGRVVGYEPSPTPTSVSDGIILSVQKNGHIDPDMIAGWLDMGKEQVIEQVVSSRMGFINPVNGLLEVRHEYLSGNVREKLSLAKAGNEDGRYSTNIEELEKVVPMDIPAHLIEFSLGSTWIDPKMYSDFVQEKYDADVKYYNINGVWAADREVYANNEKNRSAGVYSELVGKRVMGHELFAAAMNNTPITVSKTVKHYNGTTETITDKQASQMCTVRMQEIKEEFKDWARARMQADPELAAQMTRIYNDKFNAIVPKTIDDVFTPERFEGANKVINLYPHQKKSVIRATTEPLMLAHEVGTGKTFTLITTAMEMRRLGTAKKPMIVVQNATVGQFVSQAKFLYPNAKVLTVGEKDRTAEGRKEFYAKIKYNDWDIIVVPQSVFEMIPDNEERMRDFVQEKIDEKMYAIEAAREAGMDSRFINQMESELKQLEDDFATGTMNRSGSKKNEKKEAIAAQNAAVRAEEQLDRTTDDVEDFDAMGIDALLVDEAHEYKHLGFSTSMKRGVKGVDPSYSKKAASVYLKTRAVLEKSSGKNVVFATGTPISNTAAEIWTFMRYLMPKDTMVANDIYYFDDFVRNFGNITQNLEFATNGKFKENTRFASYVNLPELVRLWGSVSDTVLTKDVGYVNDKVPDMESGKAMDIFLPQSPGLVDIMRGVRTVLENYDKMSGKEKKANSHIPLTMYGIAKRAAIDPRLVDSNAIDEPLSKTNRAVEETLRTLKQTQDYKGTVAIFCDSYRRLEEDVSGKKKETFNLFQEIKRKLVAAGVPANQIVIMESGMSVAKKEKVFADVNAGNVRVILGSTQTLGTGVNIQQRLHTLIHMDAPDRPMDYTQRNGRILRQGNLHKEWGKEVRVLRFGVEDSLDVTSYQRLKTKSSFIDSVMDSKPLLANNQENRTLEEEEEGLFDNPVAVLSGSQYALLKSQAERELRKWQSKYKQWEADQVYVNAQLKRNAGQLERNAANEELYKKVVATVKEKFPDGMASVVTIDGIRCTTEEERIQAFKDVNKKMNDQIETLRNNPYGQRTSHSYTLEFDGMPVEVSLELRRDSRYNEKIKGIQVSVHRDMTYSIPELNLEDVPVSGAYIKGAVDDILENVITGKDAQERIDTIARGTKRLQEENKLLSTRDGKPFEFTQELNDARAKVEEYTTLMKKELEEKEAKYAEMGTGATVDVQDIVQDDDPSVQTFIDMVESTPELSYSEQMAYDAVREALSNANIPVVMATDEMVEKTIDDKDLRLQAVRNGMETLKKAEKFIENAIKGNAKGSFTIMLPEKTLRKIRAVAGSTFDSHNINATSIIHSKNNHGENGRKITANSIPLKDEDFRLLPYIMTSPDVVQAGSTDASGRKSIRFIKNLSNGIAIVVEKEQKNSPYDMETITMWADLSPEVADARRKTSPAIDVQNVILSTDTAKILNDAENAIASDIVELNIIDRENYSTNIGKGNLLKELDRITSPSSLKGSPLSQVKDKRLLSLLQVGKQNVDKITHKSRVGTVRGWTKDGVVYLTKDGLNPETPIHEYTHIWADAVRKYNPQLWDNVKSLMKRLPQWQQVVSDVNYQDIAGNEDSVTSEVLARYSGKRGAKRLEEDAKEYGNTTGRKGYAAQLLQRAKKALEDFWNWVNVNLFNISGFSSAEEVADRVLYDLVSGTSLSGPAAITEDILKQNTVEGLLGSEAYSAMMDDVFAGVNVISQANMVKAGDRMSALKKYISEVCSNVANRQEEALQIAASVRAAFSNMGMTVNVLDTTLLEKMWQETNSQPRQTLKESLTYENESRKVQFSIESDMGPTTNDIKMSWWDEWKEHWVDRMHSVAILKKIITTRHGAISAETDPYMSENLASARSMHEIDKFKKDIYEPLLQKVVDIQQLFVKLKLCNPKLAYKAVNDYLYAMHAPERNKHICVEEVVDKMMKKLSKEELKFFKSSNQRGALISLVGRMYNERRDPNTPFTSDTFANNIIKGAAKTKEENELLNEFRKKFTELTKTARTDVDKIFKSKRGTNRSGMSDQEAKEILAKYVTPETKPLLEQLSAIVRRSNNFTLDTWLKYSLIDKDTYDSYKDMYKNYIPLRSWAEKEDVDYDSLGKTAFNHASEIINLNRKAYGRSSRADDPIAYIGSLAQSAVVVGNKNMVHLNAFRLIQQNKEILEDVAILPQIYYVEVEGSDEVMAFDVKPPQEYFDKGLVTTKTNKSYRWHKTNAEYEAHTVPVMIDGARYMIVFKGNIGVKIASALNNTNVNHWAAADALRPLTRWLSAVRTSYSPAFVFVNFVRDFLFGNMAYAIEGGNVAALNRNLMHAFKAIHKAETTSTGTSKVDRLYEEFRREGGQTGFIHMRKLEQIKKENEVMRRKMAGQRNASDIIWRNFLMKLGKGSMEYLSVMSENAMRFAVYITEREKGTSAKDAAYKAHEITVNFNRKGTYSGNMNAFYSFFNASVQGTYRLWQLGKTYPKRTAVAIGSLALAKLTAAMIASLVGGDDYDELSDYVKFSNMVIPVGEDEQGKTVFFTIPMPQGMRAFTNLADVTVDVIRGNKSVWDAISTFTLNAAGEFIPLSVDAIDLTGRQSGQSIVAPFVPTAIQPFFDVWSNRDFKGDPIYKEDFTKGTEDYTPQYKKVYANANPILVGTSKWLNNIAGGSDEMSSAIKFNRESGEVSRRWYGYAMDWNPASAEHIINGYLGGMSTFASNIIKTLHAAIDEDVDLELYNLPIAGRFVRQAYYKEGYNTWYEVSDMVKDIQAMERALYREKDWDGYRAFKQNSYNTELVVRFNNYNDRVKQLQEVIKSGNLSTQEVRKYRKEVDELIAKASKEFELIMERYEEN